MTAMAMRTPSGWTSPVPAIADDEVLVGVEAAGLDRGTWHLLTGQPYLVRMATGFAARASHALGRDVAGKVVAIGSAVHKIAVGDPVFGVATGSFAEYARAKSGSSEQNPTRYPRSKAVPGISGMTALQAIDAAQPGSGPACSS